VPAGRRGVVESVLRGKSGEVVEQLSRRMPMTQRLLDGRANELANLARVIGS
jgi:hypothetical protein